MQKPKMMWILTREGKAYSDEGLRTIKQQIKKIYNDDSNFIVSMGHQLNNPEHLANALDRDDGSGYLVLSMKSNGVYFTGDIGIHASADLIRQHKNMNPWLVMAYIANKKFPGLCDDDGIPESLT